MWFNFIAKLSNLVRSSETRLNFKPRLKYGYFHLKLYQMFQDFNFDNFFLQRYVRRHSINLIKDDIHNYLHNIEKITISFLKNIR